MARNSIRRSPPPVRTLQLGNQVISTTQVSDELSGYVDVLLGRKPPPIENGILTLQETASAYFARGLEIEMTLHRAERDGRITRGDQFYKLRTGELRAFLELAKDAVELGSRRVTAAKIEMEMKDG